LEADDDEDDIDDDENDFGGDLEENPSWFEEDPPPEEEELPPPTPLQPPKPCFTCSHCGLIFSSTAHKSMHKYHCTIHPQPKLKCQNYPRCKVEFCRPADVTRHVKKTCSFRTRIKICIPRK
jgi:hypothetical protein